MGDWRRHEEETGRDLPHDPLALLRQCIPRAVGWSTLAGLLVGAGYVALPIFQYSSAKELIASGDNWMTAIVVLGAGPGAIIGLVVGIANGLVLTAVILVSSVRHWRTRWYRRLLGAVGAVTTLLGLWGERQLFGVPYLLPAAGPSHVIVALVLAGLGGWWVGTRLARWYITETLSWDQE